MNSLKLSITLLSGILGLMVCQLGVCQTIVVKPYLQDASPNEITVMWEADDAGIGEIHYGTTPFNLNSIKESDSVTGDGSSRIHSATLEALSAGKKYYYKVIMEDMQESGLYTFTTQFSHESEKAIQLIAISDMQRDGSHPNKFEEIVEDGIIPVIYSDVGSALDQLEAIMIPGDLVVTGGNYSQWQNHFFNPSDSLLPYVPLYPVPGNHEYFGGGLPNFIKYFTLPANGASGLIEQCWYKDISNVRIIGLNSNSGAGDQTLQLNWLGELLDSTCLAQHIDFVFAQLHHPYKSELWTPGESSFTGMVIDSLEAFSSLCSKPSIHFFGHTHGYSRGQSRDHKHLWVNVATAGGAIDNWGEFPNADYEEFVKSQDEYGFVLVNVEAGTDPKFTLKRFSRGDQDTTYNNDLRDELTIYKNEWPPYQPDNIFPSDGDTLNSSCIILKASAFQGVNDTFQAAHWQVAKGGDFIDSLVATEWKQNENWYFEVDLQANDDLTDIEIGSLTSGENYFWRVRYRDENLEWSAWSDSTSFYFDSATDTLSANLILNNGAENGVNEWTGDIEALLNGECASVSPFVGSYNFAVGGVCSNESAMGEAYQNIDLSAYSTEIDAGTAYVSFGGYLRNYSGSDLPEMYLKFYDAGNAIHTTGSISSSLANWTLKENTVLIPVGTDSCHVYLKGTRNSGTDNDSYFDELHFYVVEWACADCFGDSGMDQDQDGFCSDLDCDDLNANIYPGAIETCDGIDNDCNGIADFGASVSWTGAAGNQLWSDPGNWDQGMVPLFCQEVVIANGDTLIVDGIYACKSLDASPNSSITIGQGSFLNIDSQNDGSVIPADVRGLLFINGRWEVK